MKADSKPRTARLYQPPDSVSPICQNIPLRYLGHKLQADVGGAGADIIRVIGLELMMTFQFQCCITIGKLRESHSKNTNNQRSHEGYRTHQREGR